MLLAATAISAIGLAGGLHSKFGSYEIFASILNGTMDAFLIIGAVFAGFSISGGYSNRFAQAAVLSGSGRQRFVIVKSVSFIAAMTLFYFVPLALTSTVGLIVAGPQALPHGIMQDIVAPTLLNYVCVLGMTSVFIAMGFLIKSQGAAIGINIGVYFFINVGSSLLFAFRENSIYWNPWTQYYAIETNPVSSTYIQAIAISALTLAVFLVIAFGKFSKTELK
jgi:hypothetical protein